VAARRRHHHRKPDQSDLDALDTAARATKSASPVIAHD
jgi:hypothetical protein